MSNNQPYLVNRTAAQMIERKGAAAAIGELNRSALELAVTGNRKAAAIVRAIAAAAVRLSARAGSFGGLR